MIQDIYPHSFDNQYLPGQMPGGEDILLEFSGSDLICRLENDDIIFPRVFDFKPAAAQELTWLFTVDDQRYFLNAGAALPAPEGFSAIFVDELRKKSGACPQKVFAAVTALHLNNWYTSTRFCSKCGSPVKHSEKERAMVCPACGKAFYPRINPAVIVAVKNGDELLLTKYANPRYPYYAMLSGFAEIGETFEETVRREVMEEVGLEVTNIRYFKSQPWGFSGDLLSGYYCDVCGDATIRMDHNELKEALWMKREDVPAQPDHLSLTNEMMVAFHEGRNA